MKNDLESEFRKNLIVNFMMEEEGDRVSAVYGPNYQRLMEIKKKYDPDNLFHFNQNIRPTSN